MKPRNLTFLFVICAGASAWPWTGSADDRFQENIGNITMTDTPERSDWPAPRFALCGDSVYDAAKTLEELKELPTWRGEARAITAMAADKQAAWVTADLVEAEIGCGMSPCPKRTAGPATHHAVMLWQHGSKGWDYVAWDVAAVVDAAAQAAAAKQHIVPSPIARRIDAGADEVAKLFETTIRAPKAFAETVSDRKDVVLFGSERAERTVGGVKVRAKLLHWQLALQVRDGVQAGLTSSRTVAWVAANVDATSAKSKAAATPYRIFVLYERTGTTWNVVHVSFSVVESGPTASPAKPAASASDDKEAACDDACTDYAVCYEQVHKGEDFRGGSACVSSCMAKTAADRKAFVQQAAGAKRDTKKCAKLVGK